MRKICLLSLSLVACSAIAPDLSTICPYKPITQGVFGKIVDGNNAIEENVVVDLYTTLNGVKDMKAFSTPTTRGGYQFHVDPSMYILCANNVCATVTVPTGLVDLSASDMASGLTWNPSVPVPPAVSVGPCKYGG